MLMEIKPISDAEIKELGVKEFIPTFKGNNGFVTDDKDLAKGGLFDPDIFGKTELITAPDPNVIKKCGKNGAYYTFNEMVWNPLYIYNLFTQIGCPEKDAFEFATGGAGLGLDFAKTKDLTPISIGSPDCRFWGDSMARMVAALYGIEFPENGIAMETLYILPPRLRPICRSKDNEGFCISEINFLYRSLIDHDHRYKKLRDLNAPSIIIINERRMLYVALLRLMYNDHIPSPLTMDTVYADENDEDVAEGKPLTSLITLMSQVAPKDRELVAAALHISNDTSSAVRQVRINKALLDNADAILETNGTNFSEVIRIVMQEIVRTGELPSFIAKATEWNRMSPEERLFKAIFGDEPEDRISNEKLQEWAHDFGLPELSNDTLRDLWNHNLFPAVEPDSEEHGLHRASNFAESITRIKQAKMDGTPAAPEDIMIVMKQIERDIDTMAIAMKERAMNELFKS